MYNKIFTKILDSSIWLEPDATRIVWLTCIAAMDEDGFCAFASPANLAHRANVTLTAALAALETLEGPDDNSSDHDNEGRRLERVPGGWMVLNAAKYRELVSRELAKLGNRRRVQRHREAKRAGNGVLTQANESVTLSEAETEAEARSDTHTQESVRATAVQVSPSLPRGSGRQMGRIFLHRWQLESLIATLGPLSDDFGLDSWIDGLNTQISGRALPRDPWKFVQAELHAEITRRGLAVASESAPAPQNKRIAGLMAGGEAFLRRVAAAKGRDQE